MRRFQKEKGGSRNFVTEEESYAEFEEQDEDSEDYVYVGERDLEEIMEEEEVQEALASYQQVRKAIKDQRTSRGYYDSRSVGGRGKGAGSGKGGKQASPWAVVASSSRVAAKVMVPEYT